MSDDERRDERPGDEPADEWTRDDSAVGDPADVEPAPEGEDPPDEQSSDGLDLRALAHRFRWHLTTVAVLGIALLAVALLTDFPLHDVFTVGFFERSLRAATPIALAAIGGLYAEKSGVFNIGLEGFMIFGAVNGAAAAYLLAGGSSPGQSVLWAALGVAMLVSLVYTAVFAVLTIRYEADQIVAGLAVWFLGLGFGPFTAVLLWDDVSSPPLPSIERVGIPLLAEIPFFGPVLFDTNPIVWLTIVITIAAWIFLYRTRYGYWIQAAGENPEALDTAGVSVTRVRYSAVLFSGVMAGLAGAVLAIGIGQGFGGTGPTMVDGRGWIAIVAYLFGNYNPIFTALAAVLFGAAEMLRIQLGTVGVDVPSSLMEQLPYVTVIVVLALFGRTRMPSSVGEPYESEE